MIVECKSQIDHMLIKIFALFYYDHYYYYFFQRRLAIVGGLKS